MHDATVIVQVLKTPRPVSKQIYLGPSINLVGDKGIREGNPEKRFEHKEKIRIVVIGFGKMVDQAQDIRLHVC